MIIKNLLILCFILTSIGIDIIAQQKVRPNYKENLKKIMQKYKIQDSISMEDLIYFVPTTNEEFSEYYSLTDPGMTKSDEIFYYKIISEWFDKYDKSIELYKKLIELTVFTDGEYAELYYDYLDYAFKENPKLFCEVYKLTDKNKIKEKRFHSYMIEYCKCLSEKKHK